MNLEEKKKFLFNSLYFAAWAIILYLIFKFTTAYLLPFIIGVIIAYLVQKPAVILAQKIKLKKENCAAMLSVIFYCITIFIVGLLVWLFYNYANKLMISFVNGNDFITNFKKVFDNFFFKFNSLNNNSFKNVLYETINGFTNKITDFISNVVTSFVKKIPALIFSTVVTIVATCYISKDFDRLKRFVKGVLSDSAYNKIINIKSAFLNCFQKFTVGYFWLYIITFLELFLGLLILKTPNFIVLAIIISLIDLLPVFGTGAILIPWSILSFVQSNYKNGFGLIVLYLVIMVVRNFAEPKIIGKQIDINPIFTLLFIFLGLRIGGIIGMIVLPIVLTVAFTYYRKQFYDLK